MVAKLLNMKRRKRWQGRLLLVVAACAAPVVDAGAAPRVSSRRRCAGVQLCLRGDGVLRRAFDARGGGVVAAPSVAVRSLILSTR